MAEVTGMKENTLLTRNSKGLNAWEVVKGWKEKINGGLLSVLVVRDSIAIGVINILGFLQLDSYLYMEKGLE